MSLTEHSKQADCPVCGHFAAETVDTKIQGHGSTRTMAIRECQSCYTLWGEPREFYGILEAGNGDESEE